MAVFIPSDAQAIDRLREAVEKSGASMTALTERIRRLNVWLVWLTVAIAFITTVQVLVAVNLIGR